MIEDQLGQEIPLYPPQSLRCPNRNKARILCIQPGCHSEALICFDQQCSHCISTHPRCTAIKFSIIMQKILSKKQKVTLQVQRAVQALEKIYDDTCQKLSIEKEKLRENMAYLGFNIHELDFFKKLNQGKANQILGLHGALLYKKISSVDRFQATSLSIRQYWQDNQHNLIRLIEGLRNVTRIKGSVINSQIVQDIQQIQDMFGNNKKVHQANLLFRASQHNFSIADFHKMCDDKPNTLILARTEFGKVVGAFTPIKWKLNKGKSYQKDKNGSTFLFSLTNGQKYTHGPGNIKHTAPEGIGFGITKRPLEFYIGDDAKYRAVSFFDFGDTFTFQTKDVQKSVPKHQTKENWRYLSGTNSNQNNRVRLTQWQVYAIHFG